MEKTPTQLKNKYTALQYSLFGGEFLAVVTPFVAYGIANYDEYFVEYNGTKMSIAFFLALAIMGLAIFLISKKKLEGTYATLIIGWATMTFIFYLMGQMINDIATIMFFGLIGILTASGLEFGSQKMKAKKEEIIKAMNRANEEDLAEAYKIEKRSVKVKVKK